MVSDVPKLSKPNGILTTYSALLPTGARLIVPSIRPSIPPTLDQNTDLGAETVGLVKALIKAARLVSAAVPLLGEVSAGASQGKSYAVPP